MKLADVTEISPQFQRSVRIDLDFNREAALRGYVFQHSAETTVSALTDLVRNSSSCAFTFTGPFGGGKSSLALLLASRLAGNRVVQQLATKKLGARSDRAIADTFNPGKKAWHFLPIVGSRDDLVQTLWRQLETHGFLNRARRSKDKKLADTLSEIAAKAPGGLILVIDELGKHLEAAARQGNDIFVLQQIAEVANRSNKKFVFIGILHQSFDQYATSLGRDVRDEWAKIQGRFTDLPVITPVDEVIELVGRAIVSREANHSHSINNAKIVAEEIRRNRPGYSADLWQRLNRCWPLHPATAALLGPISRRRFSQNERSVFSFLASAEPLGFQEFLRGSDIHGGTTFDPCMYWDYLRANLEPSILVSPDGHRWAQAADAVARAEARGTTVHIKITKTIALINLFRNGSGLNGTSEVIATTVTEADMKEVRAALDELRAWSIVAFRKHLGAWVIHEGSDFDIEAAVSSALRSGISFSADRLSALANLQPVVAKRLYHETGTLRWFPTEIGQVHDVDARVSSFSAEDGAAGKFLLLVRSSDQTVQQAKTAASKASERSGPYPVAVGVAENSARINDLAYELLALEVLPKRHPEIEGDAVARREIAARIAALAGLLEEEVRTAFSDTEWFVHGKRYVATAVGLSQLASELASQCFPQAPQISSELINRHRPSSNSQAAIRQLLWAMVEKPFADCLGFEGFSAERGLYETVLKQTGLHRIGDAGPAFMRPDSGSAGGFAALWNAADKLLRARDGITTFAEIFAKWEEPPIGARKGVLPVLGIAYALSNPGSLSFYREGTYQAGISAVLADALLQDAGQVGLRWFDNEKQQQSTIEAIRSAISDVLGTEVKDEPLSVAKALVRFAMALPKWTHRTTQIAENARKLVRLLLHAQDPHKLLFVELPAALAADAAPEKLEPALRKALVLLRDAYPSMLQETRNRLMQSLKYDPTDSYELSDRAKTVHGISGDLLLDAFCLRINGVKGDVSDLESLISLVTSKPPRDWTDRDVDLGNIELARLAMKFRQVELLASVKGRSPSRQSVALAISLPDSTEAKLRSVDISLEERRHVKEIAEEIRLFLVSRALDRDLCLAAMAEAAFALTEDRSADV